MVPLQTWANVYKLKSKCHTNKKKNNESCSSNHTSLQCASWMFVETMVWGNTESLNRNDGTWNHSWYFLETHPTLGNPLSLLSNSADADFVQVYMKVLICHRTSVWINASFSMQGLTTVQQRGQNHQRRARISSSITISSAMARIVPSDCREEQIWTLLWVGLFFDMTWHTEQTLGKCNGIIRWCNSFNLWFKQCFHQRGLAMKITDDACWKGWLLNQGMNYATSDLTGRSHNPLACGKLLDLSGGKCIVLF